MRISYSGLDTFSTCPAKYKLQYIDKIKTLKSKEALFGTMIHDCLKVFHEPSKPIPMIEDDLLKYFTEKWDNSIYIDKQEEAFAFHQGIDILKRYYLENQTKEFNIVNLETSFNISIGKDLHQITGRIDRIDKLEDGTFEVIDYKTSKKMPSQAIVDDNFQLSIYYLGIISRWPQIKEQNRSVKLSLYYLKHGEKLSATRTKKHIEETENKVLELITEIEKSNFEPKMNPLCDWCSYQPYCPLYKHKYIKEQKTVNSEEIKEIIKEYFKIKAKQGESNKRINELKKEINIYCDKNELDRIFGDEGYITRLSQQRFNYDSDKLKEILEPLGKWNEILTVDKVKFKKVIDSLPNNIKKEIDKVKTLGKEFKVISAKKN